MEKVNLTKEIRGINTYRNVIDTEFTEFITREPVIDQPTFNVFDFFRLYDQLFFSIPLTGENSHTSLIERSSQYLGSNVIDPEKQALIEEINTLKQQIVDLTNTYITIGSITG